MSVDQKEFLPQYAAQAVADLEEVTTAVDRAIRARGRDAVEGFLSEGDNGALYEEARFLASTIRSAVHVVLPRNGEIYRANYPMPIPTADEIESLDGLPAPTTCFEFYCDTVEPATKVITVVVDRKQVTQDQTGLVIFQTYERDSRFIPTRNGVFYPMPITWQSLGDGKIACLAKAFRVSKRREDVTDPAVINEIGTSQLRGLHAAIQCCHSLRAGATLEEQRETSPTRRWKMEKRGVGGFTYHVLKLPAGSSRQGGAGGTHDSPRFHVRRAHIRKLPTGVLTFVRQCFVGDPEKGVVDKHYKVERKA